MSGHRNTSKPACNSGDGTRPSRRDVLAGAGATIGAFALPELHRAGIVVRADNHRPAGHGEEEAKPFPFGNEPARERKSFYDLSDTEVQLFCEAVAYMRDGKGKDHPLSVHSPLQWDNLVSAHAHHCTEAGPDEQVHWSWYFLPWHRAYLFFIERHIANVISTILAKPDAGKKFALPYWDWVTQKAMPNTKAREAKKLQSPLFGLDLSTDFDPSPAGSGDPVPHNLGLVDGYRGPTLDKPEMKPENEDIKGWKDYTKLIRDRYTAEEEIKELLRLPNFCMFGGFPNVDAQTGQGLLENEPHNMIHDWVGTRYGNNRDMGNLRYAALDPIFYLHHAQIDRIWSQYNYTPDPDQPPRPGDNCAFTVAMLKVWGDKAFKFLDVDGKPVLVTVRDTLKNMKTVTYVEPAQGARLAVPKPDTALKALGVTVSEQAIKLTDKPVKLTLKDTLLKVDDRDVREGKPSVAILEIEVGDFYYSRRFQVRVFANNEDADEKTPVTDEHFVGSFQVLDSHAGSQRKPGGKHIFLVNVSSGSSNFFKAAPVGKPLTLTLVPSGTSSDKKPFFLDVTKITLRVYK